MKFKKIAKTYTKWGDRHKLVHRDGDWVIYERKSGISGEVYHHEVMMVRREEAGEVFGKKVGARETLPGPSDWGRYGWTCMGGLEKAKQLMERKRSERDQIKVEAVKKTKAVRKRTRRK